MRVILCVKNNETKEKTGGKAGRMRGRKSEGRRKRTKNRDRISQQNYLVSNRICFNKKSGCLIRENKNILKP